jgi:hypothetical protein
MNKFFSIAVLFIASICLSVFLSCKKGEDVTAALHDTQINEGCTSAGSWIKLIDSEKYPESWESSAGIFRSSITKDKWIKDVSAVRKLMGKVKVRETASKEFHAELPGVPDGEYVIIKYRSSFANKRNTVELVTTAKDADGEWRVAGYFVK